MKSDKATVDRQWHIPLPEGKRIEFIGAWTNLGEHRAGFVEHEAYVSCSQKVINAHVALGGFNMWYPGPNDHELTRIRMDVYLKRAGFSGPTEGEYSPEELKRMQREVFVGLRYELTDEDTSDDDDVNACVAGFLVIAYTEPD